METPTSMVAGCTVDLSLLAGCTVAGYHLEALIGVGGMSVVYRGRRKAGGIDQVVAVKLLRLGGESDEEVSVFERECRAISRVAHPCIPRLLDFGRTHYGGYYIAMELVQGVPIDEYCECNHLSLISRVKLFLGLATVVAHAHDQQTIHGDIKCTNVLVDSLGCPRLLDFGIAEIKVVVNGERGTVWLTPPFAAPERYLGQMTVTSDVYSLGVLLGIVLAGSAQRRRPTTGLPADLESIVRCSIDTDPQRRYSSVQAMIEDLRAYMEHRPVKVRGTSVLYRTQCLCRRRWRTLTVLFGLATLAATALTYFIVAKENAASANSRLAAITRMIGPALSSGMKTSDRQALLTKVTEALNTVDTTNLPADTRFRIAAFLSEVGDVAGNAMSANVGDTAKALSLYSTAIKLLTDTGNIEPKVCILRASLERRLGDIAAANMDLSNADRHYATAEKELTRYRGHQKYSEYVLVEWTKTLFQRGFVSEAASRPGDALKHYRRIVDVAIELRARNWALGETERVNAEVKLAKVAADTGDWQEGARIVADAIEGLRTLTSRQFGPPRFFDLAAGLLLQGDILAKHHPEKAHPAYAEAITLLKNLMAADPENVEYVRVLAQGHLSRANLYLDQKKFDRAKADTKAALSAEAPLAHRVGADGYDVELFAWIALTTPFVELQDLQSVHSLLLSRTQATSDSPTLLDLLARSYAAMCDYDRAVRIEEQALNLLSPDANKSEYEAALRLFKRQRRTQGCLPHRNGDQENTR